MKAALDLLPSIKRIPKRRVAPILLSVLLPVLLIYAAVLLRAASLKKISMLYDEQITRAVAVNIWKGDLRNNWKYADVPSEFRIDCYNFSSYMYADALAAGSHSPHPLFRERLFSAISGSLAIIFFYLIALRCFGWKTAFAALGIMAVFPLLVQDSHYARPEAFVTLLFAIAYFFTISLLRTTRFLPCLATSSFCYGLLIASKISFIPLAILPLICLAVRKNVNWRVVSAWIFLVVAGFFVGVPDAFFHPQAFLNGVRMLHDHYAHEHPPHSLIDSRYCFPLLSIYFWQTLGPVLCLLAMIGIVSFLYRHLYLQLALFAGPVLFYFGYFSLQRTFFERNLSHVAPLAAILSGVGLVWLTDFLPNRVKDAAFAGILLFALIQPALISRKLVFVAMRISLEDYTESYVNTLHKREQVPVVPVHGLLTLGHVHDLTTLVEQFASDIVVPIYDYNDRYTIRMLEILRQQVRVREVGFQPTLFPQFAPNTILTYHSPNLRYIRLTEPDYYQLEGVAFASWRRIVGTILTPPVRMVSWARNGMHPAASIPTWHDEFFGSYTPEGGDGNRGRIEIGPIRTGQLTRIGIPLMTGPSCVGLSVEVYDHVTHRSLVQLNPPPNLPRWAIWQVNLPAGAISQVDVMAQDNGAGWGQWLGIGLPLRLK